MRLKLYVNNRVFHLVSQIVSFQETIYFLPLLMSANQIFYFHSQVNGFTKFVFVFCIIYFNLDCYRRPDVGCGIRVQEMFDAISNSPSHLSSRYAVTMGLTHYTTTLTTAFTLSTPPTAPVTPSSAQGRGRYCRSPPAIMRVQKVTLSLQGCRLIRSYVSALSMTLLMGGEGGGGNLNEKLIIRPSSYGTTWVCVYAFRVQSFDPQYVYEYSKV